MLRRSQAMGSDGLCGREASPACTDRRRVCVQCSDCGAVISVKRVKSLKFNISFSKIASHWGISMFLGSLVIELGNQGIVRELSGRESKRS